MNKHFKKAEGLVADAIRDLQRFLPSDGEDISCYNPESLDSSIVKLIQARTAIGIGHHIGGENLSDGLVAGPSKENEKLRDLICHAWVHSAYIRSGWGRMTTEQKELFERVAKEELDKGE